MIEQEPPVPTPRRPQRDNIHFIWTALNRYGLGRTLEEHLDEDEVELPLSLTED